MGNLDSHILSSTGALKELAHVEITSETYNALPNQYIEVTGNDNPPGGIQVILPNSGAEIGDLIVIKNRYTVDTDNENNISIANVVGGVTQMRTYNEMYTFIYMDDGWRTFNNWKTNFGITKAFSGGGQTTWVIDHFIGSFPTFQLYDTATGEIFMTDVVYTNANTLTVKFKKPTTDFSIRLFIT